MSNDQGDTHGTQSGKKPKYYVKELNRRGGAPNWTVYERTKGTVGTEAGARAVCLCYDEFTAQRIMGLLDAAEPKPQGLDDLQA